MPNFSSATFSHMPLQPHLIDKIAQVLRPAGLESKT